MIDKMKMNKMMKRKMKMMKMMTMGFLRDCAHCLVALGTQRQFGLGSPEPRQDSARPVLPIEQAKEPPAAT